MPRFKVTKKRSKKMVYLLRELQRHKDDLDDSWSTSEDDCNVTDTDTDSDEDPTLSKLNTQTITDTDSDEEWTLSKNNTQTNTDTDSDEDSKKVWTPSKSVKIDTQTATDTDSDEESKMEARAYSKGWRADWKLSDPTFLKRIAASARVSMQLCVHCRFGSR